MEKNLNIIKRKKTIVMINVKMRNTIKEMRKIVIQLIRKILLFG